MKPLQNQCFNVEAEERKGELCAHLGSEAGFSSIGEDTGWKELPATSSLWPPGHSSSLARLHPCPGSPQVARLVTAGGVLPNPTHRSDGRIHSSCRRGQDQVCHFQGTRQECAAREKQALTPPPGPADVGGGSQRRWSAVWQIENIFQCGPRI